MKQLQAPIKIGLIGCGGIAKTHLNPYLQLNHLFPIAAAETGKHIVVEKPMAMNL